MSGKIVKSIPWRIYQDPRMVKGKLDLDDEEEEDEEKEEPDDKDYIFVSCPKCGNRFHKCVRD